MARFSDNPIKSVLAGNELLPGTDPSSGDDICVTPDIFLTYCAQNLPLATATGNGLFTSSGFSRLFDETYTKDEIDAKNAILKVNVIGFFVGVVADGYLEFYCHLDNDMTITEAFFKTSSGTVTASVQIDGVSVTGLANIAVTSAGQRVAATALNFLPSASKLGLLFATNAAALNFYVTIAGTMNLP